MTADLEVSTDERASLRFFAFYVANGTLLLPAEPRDDHVDYLEVLVEPGPQLGQLVCVYAHTLAAQLRGQPRGGPSSRAAAWLRHTLRPDTPLTPTVEPHELVPGCGVAWLDAVARFAVDLGAGTLEPDLLADLPYVSTLTDTGSTLERIFAIFANVLTLTGDEAHARRRTAQHVRSLVDDEYEPDPELTEAETELYL